MPIYDRIFYKRLALDIRLGVGGDMKLTLSYKAEVFHDRATARLFQLTVDKYNEVITYLIQIIQTHWDELKQLKTTNHRLTRIEKLTHTTKTNPTPKYSDFDTKFNQLPSYLRRDAIHAALGAYSSYTSLTQNWINGGKQGKPPTLTLKRNQTPSFYKGNMHRISDKTFQSIQLKLFNGKAWGWYTISIKSQDAKYIQKKNELLNTRILAPTLVRKGKWKWDLRFAFEIESDLTDATIFEERICSVDLGVNTDATCCVMESDGTIVARRFIDHKAEKTVMYHLLGKLRKSQSQGAKKIKKKWARINRCNDNLTKQVVAAIIDFAVEYSCTSIVCEFLDIKGKIKGSRKYKLKQWRKRDIYHHLYDQAHLWGMRIHQVCAWGTSRLAFDGSGRVQRGKYIVGDDGNSLGYSYSWVRFASGKLYHADLNACYNIGARYFVREIIKALGVIQESDRLADVLGGSGRSSHTLSSLINLNTVLKDRKAFEALTATVV